MMKPYKDALAEARKVGAAHATGDAFLAQTCKILSVAYPVNPEMLYLGAAARELSARELVQLAHDDPGEFAFVPFDALV